MKVLFIDTVHAVLWERLSAAGMQCVAGYDWPKERIEQEISSFEGIVIRSRFKVDKSFLALASKLRFIARSGSGLENIDLVQADVQRIKVIHSPEGNAPAVGEHCLGLLLALSNHIVKGHNEIVRNTWNREGNRGWEIAGKTVGIIGLGHTGTAFAKTLSGFDCAVLAYDKYKPKLHSPFAQRVEMATLFEKADIISLHLPLSIETNYLVNTRWIEQVQKPFVLLNTCRGPVVQTNALVGGLKSGKILGAGLDVLEYEKTSFEIDATQLPEDFQYLTQASNVVLSPHVAGWTQESYIRLSVVLADKILQAFQ